MSKVDVSIVIPACNEQFLEPTVNGILDNARSKMELIVVCDNYRPDFEFRKDDRLKVIYRGGQNSMRESINAGVAIAEGDYIIKCDGHILWDESFDLKLLEDASPDIMLLPLRKRLDVVNWCIEPHDPIKKPDVSLEYLCFPDAKNGDWGGATLSGKIWTDKILATEDVMLQDAVAAQGSAWCMARKTFNDLQLLDYQLFGPFWQENQEEVFALTLRHGTKENPGRAIATRRTWFAHQHKGPKKEVVMPDGSTQTIGGRRYGLRESWLRQGRNAVMRFFEGEKVYKDQHSPLSALISMHMPMPTWDDEKLEALRDRERSHGWDV
jgi:hypothetical protein